MAGVKAWEVFGEVGLQGMGKVNRDLAAFNVMGQKVGKNVLGVNKKMLLLAGGAAAVGGAVAVLASKSVSAFADFDAAMTESLAIMGDVSDTMQGEMVDAAEKMGQTTLFSATQAAESYFFLASAGLDAEQSVAALPQVAAFAQAGMFDMATATDLATDAQSALGLTVDDAQQNLENLTRVTDVLVKANTLANASVEQFATALTSQAGAALKTVNKDIEEGVAVLAAFADQGVKAEKAGNALSRVIRILTAQAVKNADAYEELGIQVFDADGEMRNFADIIKNLEDVLLPMSTELRAAALQALGFRARLQGVILPLLGTSDAIRKYEAAQRDANGITKEVAEKQLDTLRSQLKLTTDAFTVLLSKIGAGITEGGRFIPILKGMRGGIIALTEAGEDMAEAWSREDGFIGVMKDAAFAILPPSIRATLQVASAAGSAQEEAEKAAERWSDFNTELLETTQIGPTVDDILGDIFSRFQEPPKVPGPTGLVPEVRDLDIETRETLKTGFDLPDPVQVTDELGRQLEASRAGEKIAQAIFGDPDDFDPAEQPELDQVTSQFEEWLIGTAGEGSESALPEFRQIGADLVRGLVSGSFDMEEFLKQSFITLASNFILGPLGGALGIASPSKLTAEMGRNMVLGLEEGIRERGRAGGVAAAWAEVLATVPTGTQAGFAGRASSLDRPGLDLSGMPPARNPLAMMRDRDWQEFLRGSQDAARDDGALL